MEKIPEYILEAINCGEARACDYYTKYGEANVEKALQELKNSDEIILSKIDAGKFYDAVNKRIEKRSSKLKVNLRAYMPLAAAAALLLIVLPGMMRIRHNSSVSNAEETVRIKGSASENPQLFLFQKKNGDVLSLKDGTKVEEGDLIQIGFNPKGKKYGVIFSIDGNHNITNHLGDEDLNACELNNSISYLDFSYELDSAPDYEVFIMITSDKPFDFKDEAEIMKNKNLSYLRKGSYAHRGYEFTTFVLLK